MCLRTFPIKYLSQVKSINNRLRSVVLLSVGWFFLSPVISFAQTQGAIPDNFSITNAWIKLAPPGSSVNAAYMDLHNHALEEKVIVAVTADCCAQVMMHQTRREGDRVYMDHRDTLYIPPQGELQLKPGGLHLMLMGAKAPLQPDDSVNIAFDFSDSTQLTLRVPVKKAAHDQ